MGQAAFRPPLSGRQALQSLRTRLRDPRTAEATAHALQSLECELFLKDYEQAYAELRSDPETRAEIEAERRAFDGTLMDGLEQDS